MKSHPLLFVAILWGMPSATVAEPGPAFSSLTQGEQDRLRRMTEAPPPAERHGPYSTPMYYLMHEGYDYDGAMDAVAEKRYYLKDRAGPDHGSWKLDRNRADWQEAMIRDWAEMGLNNTHLNIYPVDGSLEIAPTYRQALKDFVRLSHQHGLKVGVRLDALGAYEAWPMNPDNPENQIDEYLVYVRDIATMMKGNAAYYVLGDELTLHPAEPDMDPKLWTPDKYLAYFKRVSAAIKQVDPDVKVSMFAASSGEWFNILYLLKNGYAEYGDAVAINHYNYQSFVQFFKEARELAPGLAFLSNGVGYQSTATAEPRFPEGDPYSRHGTEQSQARAIAKTLFTCWDLGLDTAPYYITLRNWVIRGRTYPRWFGFFGVEDYVIDAQDKLTVKRYPGWHAIATVAHTFYNKDQLAAPPFAVTASTPPSMMRSYVRQQEGGAELLLMLWNDSGPISTTLRLGSDRFRYAVEVDLFDRNVWSDVPYRLDGGAVEIDLEIGPAPRILRAWATADKP